MSPQSLKSALLQLEENSEEASVFLVQDLKSLVIVEVSSIKEEKPLEILPKVEEFVEFFQDSDFSSLEKSHLLPSFGDTKSKPISTKDCSADKHFAICSFDSEASVGGQVVPPSKDAMSIGPPPGFELLELFWKTM